MKKRILTIFMALLLILSPIANAVNYNSIFYKDAIETFLIGDYATGDILLSKNIDQAAPIASMSKIMTYFVVKEEIKKGKASMEDVVEITDDMSKFNIPGYSRFGLKTGQKFTVKELLEAVMVLSGNDATEALAIHIGGSSKKFVELMNKKAEELGLKKAHFVNPTGLTETLENNEQKFNKMTARELFKLASQILKDFPETIEYSKIESIDTPDKRKASSTLPNRDMKTMKGLKTGFTEEAGYCVTSIFDMTEKDKEQNYKLITVIMGADTTEQRNTTNKQLVEFVEANYSYSKVFDLNRSVTEFTDENTAEKYISVYPDKTFTKLAPKNKNVEIKYNLLDNLSAPYKDGEIVGSAELVLDGEIVETINLVNKGDKEKQNFFINIFESIKLFFKEIMLLF